VMSIGQGHTAYGRYAAAVGSNPLLLMAPEAQTATGGMQFSASAISLRKANRILRLSETDASRTQHDRTFLQSIGLEELRRAAPQPVPEPAGLGISDFPFTMPLKEGYDPARDFYPPIDYPEHRWSMLVDLDRCIGCAACAGACYAENNIGVVGKQHVVERRRMAWMNIIRYHDPNDMAKVKFLPMLCQHCSNAPCESVCPVYAPHHSKEGINNQIYNRCIGTRFCSQNCPYKVRRFNWFDWQWPEPINLQANPDVTVRSKGVMEKCSFCIQRIKEVRTVAKNEKRPIRDGEITPACVQTCPTDALIFGDIMDRNSRVRKLIEKNPRAYQMMGYLNTKPAVIYLKKVTQEV
jgi:Fe-S-cluster-containing dehydrogenase component